MKIQGFEIYQNLLSRYKLRVYLLSAILVILGVEMLTPLGIAVWMLYLIPLILIPIDFKRIEYLIFIFICTVFTYLALIWTQKGEWQSLRLSDQTVIVLIFWLTAWTIIEAKRKASQLVNSENHLRNFVENTPAAIAMFDLEMRYLAVSRKFRDDYRITDADVIGKTNYEIFPDLPNRWKAIHQRCLKGATETSQGDEYPRADGSIDYLKWEVKPWYRDDKAIGGILVYAEIITEQRKAEMALKESEERFYKAFYVSPVAQTISTLPEGRWIEVNDSFLKLMEFTRDEVMGRTSAELGIINLEERNQLLDSLQKRGAIEGKELIITTKSGERKFVQFTAAIIKMKDREHVISTYIDVTEARKARIVVEESNLKLREADHRKNNFLANLSHELRTPLSSILMWAQMLRQKRVSIDKFDEAITSIEKNAIVQNQLISDLLDVSSIISGKTVLDLTESNLNDIIQQAINSVLPAAQKKNLKIVTDLVPGMSIIMCDPIRMNQILWNLLTNAIKFSSPNLMIAVKTRLEKDKVEIQIVDQGKGISAEYLPHVFERFSQEDGSLTRKHSGLGLGLSIVRDLVVLHNGSIEVQSPGRGLGATFTIVLPRMTSTSLPLTSIKKPEDLTYKNDRDFGGVRILVVDDSEDTLILNRIFLEKLGADVKLASSAQEGFILFKDYKPDILLSDISMPEEDGIEFIRKIRQLPKEEGGEIPAIALTGYASREDARKVLAAGYQDHLPKPIEIEKLQSAISRIIASKSQSI